MDKKEVAKILKTLTVCYPQSFSKWDSDQMKITLEIWYEGLKNESAKLANQALKHFIYNTSNQFAPTIGEFRQQMLKEVAEPTDANELWLEVRHCMFQFSWNAQQDRAIYEELPDCVKKIYTFSDLYNMSKRSSSDNDAYEKPRFVKAVADYDKAAQRQALASGNILQIASKQKLKQLGINDTKEINHEERVSTSD